MVYVKRMMHACPPHVAGMKHCVVLTKVDALSSRYAVALVTKVASGLGCTIRKVAGSALHARNVFSCFFLHFFRDPLFCILPLFFDTFLRLKRRKMFVPAGGNNAAAE